MDLYWRDCPSLIDGLTESCIVDQCKTPVAVKRRLELRKCSGHVAVNKRRMNQQQQLNKSQHLADRRACTSRVNTCLTCRIHHGFRSYKVQRGKKKCFILPAGNCSWPVWCHTFKSVQKGQTSQDVFMPKQIKRKGEIDPWWRNQYTAIHFEKTLENWRVNVIIRSGNSIIIIIK